MCSPCLMYLPTFRSLLLTRSQPLPLSLLLLFSLLTTKMTPTHHKPKQTDTINDVSARLRRSERKRKAQAAELAEAREEAAEAKSELSLSRAREKATAQALTQREKGKGEADPARQQQRQLRERDAEISRLRDRLEAATGELSEEQVLL